MTDIFIRELKYEIKMKFYYFEHYFLHLLPVLILTRLLCGVYGLAAEFASTTQESPLVKQELGVVMVKMCANNANSVANQTHHDVKAPSWCPSHCSLTEF